jgi:trimethylamine---corrinoid protein Co-methyltransferase
MDRPSARDIQLRIREAPSSERPALEAELALYREIHESAKALLAEVGIHTRSQRIVGILEGTGLAGYDASTSRVHLLPELLDQCLASAPRTFPGDEGLNTLGVGGIPPFLYRENEPYPMPATYEELDRVIGLIQENLDVVRFLSQPVKVHKGDPLACNRIMDRLRDCIKVTCSAYLKDAEAVRWFSGREDWHDSICGVNSPLISMDAMMEALVRSAEAGNLLRLTTMPLAGRTSPHTPVSCMLLTHAETLFMLAVAQTVRRGVVCIHGGMPCTTRPDGNLAYNEDGMNLLNVAVARLNLWVSGLPACQSGGSTDKKVPDAQALEDGKRGREILCAFGVHYARHCFGVLDNLNFFSEAAFRRDCEAHRQYLGHQVDRQMSGFSPPKGTASDAGRELPAGAGTAGPAPGQGQPAKAASPVRAAAVLNPLHLPADPRAFEVIRRVASGDYHGDYHTTANLTAFEDWTRALQATGQLPARTDL